MKTIAIIPARYASTRFPGKPLADIHGYPMIWWTFQAAYKAIGEAYVAVDSDITAKVCEQYGMPYIMTSEACETCTDRVAEAAQSIDADIYVSVLGDEPCLLPEDIKRAANLIEDSAEADVCTVCLPIHSAVDAINTTTQKFALNKNHDVIYISRQPIPYPQQSVDFVIYKHVGVYVFRRQSLEFFAATPMGGIETIEGNDLMRFIENHRKVKAYVTNNNSLSVDTPKDLEKVCRMLSPLKNGQIHTYIGASRPVVGRWRRMDIVALIPARYASTRFPGKPVVDICGRPMIWWVYRQAVKAIERTYVAVDDNQTAKVCEQYSIPYIMTSPQCGTSTERVYEAAQKITADIYVVINGDEPLIDSNVIKAVIPGSAEGFFAANLMTEIKNPVEAVDSANIKVVTDECGNALFMSRSLIPYPKSRLDYKYYKHIGILAYSFEALKFFAATPKGYNEQIEDINELRFIEHGKPLKMIEVAMSSMSVDTPKDLDYVRTVIKDKITKGEILL